MAIGVGSRVGPYDITALLGEGGMGKVWRAHHNALNRDDALKVLPDALASDPERVARFRREAQVLASLNHPNIAHVHGFEQIEGSQALVMELVEGPTLADRIAQGAIPVDEALAIARQIAEALEAAHEQGIIHRDLKPANIKVRPDGTVKVLDFGLAKAMEPAGGMSASASMSPTITSPVMMTGVGMLLGTAAYMSPEQARGKAVDERSDIWAFGCVTYEMLTGTRAFEDEDVSMTLSKVLQREPDFEAFPADVPLRVRQIVRLCLRKSVRERVGDIHDVRLALDGAFETVPQLTTPVRAVARSRRGQLAWMAVAILMALTLALSLLFTRRPTPGAPEMRVEITTPATSSPLQFALSPDGRRLVFVASGDGQSRLWVRALDAVVAQPLTGTENAEYPFWSPDSRSIGFFAGGKLNRVDIGGGPTAFLSFFPMVDASSFLYRGVQKHKESTLDRWMEVNRPVWNRMIQLEPGRRRDACSSSGRARSWRGRLMPSAAHLPESGAFESAKRIAPFWFQVPPRPAAASA